jgi:hypothetical protein
MKLMSLLISSEFCIFNISANELKVCFVAFFASVLINSTLSFVSQGHSRKVCLALSMPVPQSQTADGTIRSQH